MLSPLLNWHFVHVKSLFFMLHWLTLPTITEHLLSWLYQNSTSFVDKFSHQIKWFLYSSQRLFSWKQLTPLNGSSLKTTFLYLLWQSYDFYWHLLFCLFFIISTCFSTHSKYYIQMVFFSFPINSLSYSNRCVYRLPYNLFLRLPGTFRLFPVSLPLSSLSVPFQPSSFYLSSHRRLSI